MKINRLRSKPASIAKTRWAAYATAGVATALAGSQSVEAAIHYSGILDVRFPADRNRRVTFPLDQAGDSFSFDRLHSCPIDHFNITGIVSAAWRGHPYHVYYVHKLSFGQNISSGQFVGFDPAYAGVMTAPCYSLSGDRQWFLGGTGYVGFMFNNGAGRQFGWVRVAMSRERSYAFRVLDYAYADPREPITAGQTSSAERAPDQGSLGWLALGAAGLLAWRKRRSQATS